MGQVWGEETDYTTLHDPRRLQEPTCFHLRGPTSRDLVSWDQVRGLGIVWVSPHPHGSGSCTGDHISALYLHCVLSSLRFPTSELRVLP